SELPATFVAQQHVGFAVFDDLSVFAQRKPPNQIRLRNRSTVDAQYDRLSVDRVPVETGLRVFTDGVRAVIGNIKVQIPVAINVGQGQGHAGLPRIERWPQFGEMPFAIVEEDVRSSAHRVHDQVQITIAVNVSKRGAGGVQASTAHAGLVSDVLKLPITQIPIKRVRAIQPTEVKINQT